MKGIIIYDTSHGNTKKIAETITETLKASELDVDLFDVKEVKKLSTTDYNFLVLGSPTKFGTMSFAIKFFLGKVKSEEWMNKPFAAFDTENPENVEQSRIQNKEWSAAEKIAIKLKEKNMKQLLPVLKRLCWGKRDLLLKEKLTEQKTMQRKSQLN